MAVKTDSKQKTAGTRKAVRTKKAGKTRKAAGAKRAAGTEYDILRIENQLCFPLYACAKEVVRRYREPLDALGLTYTQYIVMMVLWQYGNMTEGELGKKVHLDSGTLAPLLKRLEKQGLLTRTRLQENERKLFLSLTKEGEALKKKAVKVPKAMAGCIELPAEELVQLKILLDKALAGMEPCGAETEAKP